MRPKRQPQSVDVRRRRQLALIHAGKKELGLDDPTYRDLLDRLTEKRSAAVLSEGERETVIREMRRLGFKPQPRRRDDQEILAEKKAAGAKPQEALILSLWQELGDAGALRTGAKLTTLPAFMKRVTGKGRAHPRFLTPDEASKVIEGLRAWLGRVRRTSRGGS